MRRIQEFEYAADALRPGPLVVFAAFDALVVKVVAERPTLLDENIAELLDVGDDARAFFCADVEPDGGMRIDARGCGEAIDDALIPPDGGRERGDFSERLRELEAKINRDLYSER
jgi:hypothetical protein